MTEHDDDPERRKDPFDEIIRGMGFDPRQFDKIFQDMQRAIGKMLEEGGFEPGKPYMHGFSFKVGPDGRPEIQEFGNRPERHPGKKGFVGLSEEREPPTDVINGENEVSVTVEMPGVEKDDIDLKVTAGELTISVDTEKRKYHKVVQLPAAVKPDTTNATYKNGVLDVVIEKKHPSKDDGGVQIKVQ